MLSQSMSTSPVLEEPSVGSWSTPNQAYPESGEVSATTTVPVFHESVAGRALDKVEVAPTDLCHWQGKEKGVSESVSLRDAFFEQERLLPPLPFSQLQ